METSGPRLAQVQTVPAHILLSPGETTALSSLTFDQFGSELKRVAFSWQVLDSNAGTVTPGGVFRAGFTEGNFRNSLVVTARAPTELDLGLMQATATVTVKEFSGQLQPAMIRIFPETVNLEPGETMPLAGLVVDSNGVGIPGINFAWEMVGPEAGSISQEGRLTAGKSIRRIPRRHQSNCLTPAGRPKGVDQQKSRRPSRRPG